MAYPGFYDSDRMLVESLRRARTGPTPLVSRMTRETVYVREVEVLHSVSIAVTDDLNQYQTLVAN